ncbi:shikimate kinase [Nostoc sp. FACHB-152]|uniref:shikimate kinase n=1 Tax=Nostoc sp. FACHB-152 TaxID=2692837 RepID=UPI0016846544|nr:shikimate kinase [Nostoc sp. FACHB-152]MBD2452250.1 shikimate kinase [Nostoc sp. FACHB-152]
MYRILIFGNSGSGKTTLANKLAKDLSIPILDLDTIVWQPNQIAIRRPQEDIVNDLQNFIDHNISWVIEGCYSTLIQVALQFATEVYFLNPGISKCVENNRHRPWEAHKFPSIQAQAETFEFLQNWIQQYKEHDDEFSYSSHRSLFDQYNGRKYELTD